ncbi:P-loop containing nucleoside triphosphate hydrolase protein [Xylaria sp. FL0933]|nr:P-loop containing nucleoside triphosphate hydrolase protein [Xylaria sp. FL0933]
MACNADHDFGPALPLNDPQCRMFDFTLFFEHLFFNLIPSLIITFLAILRSWRCRRRRKIIAWPSHRARKSVVLILLGALQVVQIAILARDSRGDARFYSTLAIQAASLAFVAILTLIVLSWLEHSRSPGPSLLIQIYLFATLLLDATCLRSSWLITASTKSGSALAGTQGAAIGLKVISLVVESWKKPASRYIKPESYDLYWSEQRTGLFGRTFLSWLYPIFSSGYRRPLTPDDLGVLETSLSGTDLTLDLEKSWSAARSKGRWRLVVALMATFYQDLLLIHLPRLGLVAFMITQPLLVRTTLSYITENTYKPAYFGYSLVAAYALTYSGVAIMTLWSQHLTFRLLTKVRGALVGMIFKFSLNVPAQDSESSARPVNLMSTDVDRISQTMQWVVHIIPNILQVGLGLWILSSQLKATIVAPVLIAGACGIAASQIGQKTPVRQARWMQSIQTRVKATTLALTHIKAIKMLGLSSVIAARIQETRRVEMDSQKSFRRLQVLVTAIGNIPAMLSPPLTLSAFAIAQAVTHQTDFDVVVAFSTLSLLSILIMPIAELVSVPTNLLSALSCLDRIQAFLLEAKYQDPRVTIADRPLPPVSQGGNLRRDDERNQAVLRSPRSCLESTTPASIEPHSSGAPSGITLVDIRNGSFSWEREDPPFLRNINFQLFSSDVIMISGPIGAGKSMLLNSILGETTLTDGSLACLSTKDIAYCAQEPWIPNVRLREAILGSSLFIPDRYAEVIQLCQLREDIDQMPDKDETLVGDGGSRLSGGQRQRLALARAVYSEKKLLLLDDPFSALDTRVAHVIFHSLLGESGFLRREGRTVVLTTQNPQWLPYANKIMLLENGRIVHTGSFENLKDILQPKTLLERAGESENFAGESHVANAVSIAKATAQTPAQNQVNNESMAASKPRKQSALVFYMKSMGTLRLFVFMVLTVILVSLNTGQTLWLKFWVNQYPLEPNPNPGYWAGIYVLLGILAVLAIAAETGYFFTQILPRSSLDIHKKLLIILRAPMSFFAEHDTGTILNLFTSDLNHMDLPLSLSFLMTIEKTAAALSELALTSIASGYLAASIPLVILTVYAIQRIYGRTSRQLRVLELAAKAPLFAHFLESFDGRVTLRSFGWTEAAERRNMEYLDASQRPHYLLFCLQRWLTLVLDLIAAGLATLLVAVAVALRDKIDPASLGVGLVSVIGFGQVLTQLVTNWSNLDTSLGAVSRIKRYVTETPVEERSDYCGLEIPETWPSRGEIVLRNVSCSYGTTRILKDINLRFEAGTKTAICGRTGSGKSTLISTLVRLIELDSGRIEIDGLDITHIALDRLRKTVVVVPQDALFIDGSVRFNLNPYDDSELDYDALLSVLKDTGLENIISNHGGLEAEMRPDWFSTGQAQLFCLCRAMLRAKGKNTGVLLLDEATSHLDSSTTERMNTILDSTFRGWTVLMVTHDTKSILKHGFDRVIVLHEGTIAEDGELNVLLSR